MVACLHGCSLASPSGWLHALGLGLSDRSTEPRKDQAGLEPEDATLLREVRRRTMFSCFVMDRLIGCGETRAWAINSEDLHIQLPCPDIMFDLREERYTGFLHAPKNALASPEDGHKRLGMLHTAP